MMRLWAGSYARKTSRWGSATLSTAAHVVLIAGWVVATLPAADVPKESLANHVYYIPPPDHESGQQGSRERVHYVDILRKGPEIGDVPTKVGDGAPVIVDKPIGRAAPDSETKPSVAPVAGPRDSVFSILEVDSAVVRSAASAAPAYPLKLLQAHVTGVVSARYVVDTTGFADTASFKVLNSPKSEFVDAVRDALPYMRFSPAKIGNLKVRQLVEQQFTFRITDPTPVVAPVKKP